MAAKIKMAGKTKNKLLKIQFRTDSRITRSIYFNYLDDTGRQSTKLPLSQGTPILNVHIFDSYEGKGLIDTLRSS